MKLPFEDFDLDDQEKRDHKLTITERFTIKILLGIARLLLHKIGKARTYGELYDIADKISDFGDDMSQEVRNLETIEPISETNFKTVLITASKKFKECIN